MELAQAMAMEASVRERDLEVKGFKDKNAIQLKNNGVKGFKLVMCISICVHLEIMTPVQFVAVGWKPVCS